eukprot:TRINITY_DN17_c0_g1_i11.p1 TRINITY_DN17_c0_g1~~TRINITY_DN17_c0_g1_i11.p1  ORF type:complete len:763 (-),score=249.75 TRINITY_DN17_c0_g1_i11:63-2351(-)
MSASAHNLGPHPFGVGLRGEQKAQYFEQKALKFEQQGNARKAQRNREKAARSRSRQQAKLQPGFAQKKRMPGQLGANQNTRIVRYDQKATQYESAGNHQKAYHNRYKANFLRNKAGVPITTYTYLPGSTTWLTSQPAQIQQFYTVHTFAPVQTIMHQAAVHEVVKPTQVEEVQPVIHRQIEKTEVHQVTQPILERNVLPTQVSDRVLPTQVKPDVVLGGPAPSMAVEQSSRVVENTQHTTVVKPALVQEVIRPHIIEEIQPVVYREVTAPSLIRETQPISERIHEAPIVTREIRQPIIHHQVTNYSFNAGMGHGVLPFGISLRGEQKAQYYENKALHWDQVGNPAKAQRNREKALRSRQRMQARAAPGFVARPRIPGQLRPNQQTRIGKYEQRALAYEQQGNHQAALRNHQKANFLRNKAGVPVTNYPVSQGTQSFLTHHGYQAQPTLGQNHHVGGAAGLGHPFGLGLRGEEKARHFDNKAIQYEKAGNAAKAQRNREKAARVRSRQTAKSQPGFVHKTRIPGQLGANQNNKIQRYEQRSLKYEREGNHQKALRNSQKANFLRNKAGVAPVNYPLAPATQTYLTQQPGYGQPVSYGSTQRTAVQAPAQQHGLSGALGALHLNKGAATRVVPGSTNADGTALGHHYAPVGVLGSGFGLKGEEKARAFDNKAEEWAKAGNASKSQRNRDKAARVRSKLSAGQPGKVRTPGTMSAKQQAKVQRFEQRALAADAQNKAAKAIRARQKANRIRTKTGVPHTVYPGTA